jgi:peptidoglycan/xylan/chitin deacetylase (PgdA/CDA1 family)
MPTFSVCLTFDFDALSPWVYEMAEGNVAALSRGEFGAVAVPRILELLDRHNVPATFFVPGHTALAYPELVREIRDRGHELGHHGFVHEGLSRLDRATEEQHLVRGLEALDEVAGVRPAGYRAPGVDVSVNTVELLLEHGFRYDASFSATDFEPFYLRTGDRFPPDGPYEFGERVDLVGIPFAWHLSDFQYFEFAGGALVRQDPPSTVYEIWDGELRWGHANVPGGVFVLTMHPQAIGRGPRLAIVDRLIETAKGLDGATFERLGDYAERWRTANPL